MESCVAAHGEAPRPLTQRKAKGMTSALSPPGFNFGSTFMYLVVWTSCLSSVSCSSVL